MNSKTNRYRRYRFPPEIISRAIWLYHRFCLSFRVLEECIAPGFPETFLREGAHSSWAERSTESKAIGPTEGEELQHQRYP